MRSLRVLARLLLVAALGWGALLAAYYGALYLLWGQCPTDLAAVLAYTAGATLVAVTLAYAPALALLDRIAAVRRSRLAPAVAAVAIGVLPTLLVVVAAGGGGDVRRALASPEVGLLLIGFAVFGLVFGGGWRWARGNGDQRPG